MCDVFEVRGGVLVGVRNRVAYLPATIPQLGVGWLMLINLLSHILWGLWADDCVYI